jgi:RIO kinase 1
VSVPQPVASAENALLMGYYGDADGAAPALNEVRLERDEAEPLYHAVLRSIERMLHHDLIHGDLSAYNILYWDGEIVLIDFPQVVDSQRNTQAYAILQRDVTRVCEYFARQGVPADANAVLRRLWQRYMRPIAERRAADALIQRDTDA